MTRAYAYAAGGLIATFTVTPALSALILPEHVEETETSWCGCCIASTRQCSASRQKQQP
jgi:hypothetical protein